jgi:rod shape-determining protein MreD
MIRAYAFLLLAGFLAVVLQTELPRYLFADRIHLDLIFVMVVLLGLFRDPVQGSLMAFLLGGIEDYFSGLPVAGVFLFSRTLIFILANLLRRRFSVLSPLAQFLFALVLGAADQLLLYLLILWFSSPGAGPFARWPFSLAEVLLNAGLAPFLYLVMSWVPNLFEDGGTRR